jgi:hypothetical protein
MTLQKESVKMIVHTNIMPTVTAEDKKRGSANRIGTSIGVLVIEEVPNWKV